MNGYTEYERDTKRQISFLIRQGGKQNCEAARDLARKFLSNKWRAAKRRTLLNTVKYFVSVMNGQDTCNQRKAEQ